MPKSKQKKQPSQNVQPPAEKQPRGGLNAGSIHQRHFKWSTVDCDLDGPFGWHNSQHEVLLREILPKLQNFESQTWGDIELRSNGKHHFIPVTDLCADAKARLPETKFDGLEDLFSLRLEGAMRLWGSREGNVFQVVWYDPEHQVYPVEKDHGDKKKKQMREQRNRQSGSK